MTDTVNHPPHYNAHLSGIEAITLCEWLGFCAGNALKYAWRAGQKGRLREDLEKSLWYIRRMQKENRASAGFRGLPPDLVEVARSVVNAEPRGSLLAVMIHQLALPAVIREEHLENAEYALLRAIEGIKRHKNVIQTSRLDGLPYQSACGSRDESQERTFDDAEVTCEECRSLAP